MISVPISYQKTYRKPNCPPVQHADIQTDVQTVKKYPQFAIGVKTGKDVALTRPLIQLLTFLKDVKNIKFFAEVPGIMIGDYEAIDVVSKLASFKY
jgi:hypothetical protein